MNNALLQIYHKLPSSSRSIAATLRGYYLRSWRYSAETDDLITEAIRREKWTPEQWQLWLSQRLKFVLNRAATRVPYYREQWEKRRKAGDDSPWDRLENWPILEKEPVRKDSRAFVADDCNVKKMFHEQTSGTTGKSLELWWSRDTVRTWYAWFEARWRQWYGVNRYDRWAILGGQLIAPVEQREPPFWVWNAALNQLYLSAYHLAPDLIPHYLEALARYRITYLWGYTSSLYALAQEVIRHKRRDIKMRVVIANAEPLYEHQREVISAAFHCPVRETYGMSEIVAAASECEAGVLHQWPEAGIIEVLQGDLPVPNGQTGDLICTGLLNADMPLIRYRVGDRGAIGAGHETCSCGRSLPIISKIEGRTDDVLYTRDGRAIGRLDPVFKARLPMREAQIIQEALDCVRVRYVPSPEYTPEAGKSLTEMLRSRLGAIEVILEPLTEIPRSSNGKFRAVICKLPPELRGAHHNVHQA